MCWSGGRCALTGLDRCVHPVITRLAAHLAVLMQHAFALHSYSFQDGDGRGIAVKDGGLDALKVHGIVRPIHDGTCGVRCQAAALVTRVKVIG